MQAARIVVMAPPGSVSKSVAETFVKRSEIIMFTLDRAEGPGLGRGHPLGPRQFRALAVPAIPGGPVHPDRCQRRVPAHQRSHLLDCVIDHLDSPFSAVLSVASDSNSAESFPWISTTCLDLSRSPVSRWTCRSRRAISRSRGSAF